MYPLIDVFGREIGTYGIFAVIGCLLAVFFFYRNTKYDDFMIEDTILLAVPTFIGLIIGGHIVYGLTHADVLLKLMFNLDKLSFKQIVGVLGACFGGSVFYGGFLGALAAFMIFTKKYNKEMRSKLIDTFAICIPLFHTFGRIGCFFGGCCYGIESELGFTAHNNPLVPELNGVCRLPTPLFEAAGNFLIFIALLALHKKGLMKGRIVYLYLLIYPCMRFGLEFLRGDAVRGIFFGLSTSQWISLILFAVSASYLMFSKLLMQKRE